MSNMFQPQKFLELEHPEANRSSIQNVIDFPSSNINIDFMVNF